MFFNKNKDESILSVIKAILDAQDTDIVITNSDCTILLMNNHANDHLSSIPTTKPDICMEGYSYLYNTLCTYCPNKISDTQNIPANIEIEDKDGFYYSVAFHNIQWINGKNVTTIFLRNISEERKTMKKLYSLAYIDQLTNIANRRKLKEDFDSIEQQVVGSKVSGAMAIFDIDHFKNINDKYGHNIGDIMLVRLTSHLEAEEAFSGHLYRLGGDEFVFLFAEPAARFKTQKECQDYYHNLLMGTLRTYTLPNIESQCTLSMGIALFPWHGHRFSDLLRKADIALYKAKEGGRNQICLYEEAFDSAQKLKDIFINIQPILERNGNTHGYELVDKGAQEESINDSLNLDEYDRSMETLGLNELESNMQFFISYSNQLLNKAVVKHLPINRFIVQIKISNEFGEKELNKCTELRAFGYSLRIAGINKHNAVPEVLKLAKYCSFDPGETDDSFKRTLIARNQGIMFIATEVNTIPQYERAKEMGYALFQGFFFSQPTVVKKTKEIDQLKVNYLRLLSLTSTDDYVDFHEISSVISSDVALSYKLLRLLNSVGTGLRHPVSSIALALTYLGEVNLKKWIAILAVRGVSEEKPMELIRLSLIRAQFGELLCELLKPQRNKKHVFLVGLLSLLEVALEMSKADIFKEITVAAEIRDSLLTNNGPHSDLVTFFSDYEYARWEEVSKFSSDNQLTDVQVNDAYVSAVKWYNNMLSSI